MTFYKNLQCAHFPLHLALVDPPRMNHLTEKENEIGSCTFVYFYGHLLFLQRN